MYLIKWRKPDTVNTETLNVIEFFVDTCKREKKNTF